MGSVEEMRSHAFGNRRPSRPSLSSASARYSSAPSLGRSSRPVSRPCSRPGTNSESARSFSGTIGPRRPVAYMDAPHTNPDFVWNGYRPNGRPSTSSTARPVSKAAAGPSTPEDQGIPFENSHKPEVGRGNRPGYTKLPYGASTDVDRKTSSQRADLDSLPLPPVDIQEPENTHVQRPAVISEFATSNLAVSKVSGTSLQGQTSIRPQIEREAVVQEDDDRPPCPRGRDRLSKVFSVKWSAKRLLG